LLKRAALADEVLAVMETWLDGSVPIARDGAGEVRFGSIAGGFGHLAQTPEERIGGHRH